MIEQNNNFVFVLTIAQTIFTLSHAYILTETEINVYYHWIAFTHNFTLNIHCD